MENGGDQALQNQLPAVYAPLSSGYTMEIYVPAVF